MSEDDRLRGRPTTHQPGESVTPAADFSTMTVADIIDAVATLKADAVVPDEDGVIAEIPVHPDSVLGRMGLRLVVAREDPT